MRTCKRQRRRLWWGIGVAVALLLAATVIHAEYYAVTVTRVDQDLYKVEYQSPTVYIVTRYCYEYVHHEDAVLEYEEHSYDNRIVFDNGGSCEVEDVLVVQGR